MKPNQSIKKQIQSILNKCVIKTPTINNDDPLISCEEINDIIIEQIDNKYKNIETMFTTIPICDDLKLLYFLIGNPTKEYNINNWNIFSLNEVCDNYKLMKGFTNNQIVDFAYMFIGMGHMLICAYDSKTTSFFIRRGGGSNGFDRELNFDFFCNYKAQEDNHVDFQYILDVFNGKYNLNDDKFKIVEN